MAIHVSSPSSHSIKGQRSVTYSGKRDTQSYLGYEMGHPPTTFCLLRGASTPPICSQTGASSLIVFVSSALLFGVKSRPSYSFAPEDVFPSCSASNGARASHSRIKYRARSIQGAPSQYTRRGSCRSPRSRVVPTRISEQTTHDKDRY